MNGRGVTKFAVYWNLTLCDVKSGSHCAFLTENFYFPKKKKMHYLIKTIIRLPPLHVSALLCHLPGVYSANTQNGL